MAQRRRVNIPVSSEFRIIARIQHRSIAKQAALILDDYVQSWRAKVPLQPLDQATGQPGAKGSG
jgi:hypothetical protein